MLKTKNVYVLASGIGVVHRVGSGTFAHVFSDEVNLISLRKQR